MVTILLLPSPTFGREKFSFGTENNIHIISDKAFRNSKERKFSAIGNVIITYQGNTIYGERANFQFDTGLAIIEGNIRYVGSRTTLYGTKLEYNFKTKLFNLQNARILSDNYIVLGKLFSRLPNGEILCTDAEYTTCKDCPESWSIFGKKIRIIPDEYIHVNHAYIKVKGVTVMYVPYIVLPIKKDRETGLLFPKLSWDLKEGIHYQQPWFWAIAQNADLTLTPSAFGKRGKGNEFQFRHAPEENFWYEFNSFHLDDKIYIPNKHNNETSGSSTFRHLSEWEHHFNSSKNWNHHFHYNFARDLDTDRGIGDFSDERVQGSDLGGSSFIDFRNNWLSLSTEGHFRRNQLFSQTLEFDHRYVQILPKVKLNSVPYRIFQSKIPMFHNATFDFEGDATVFKQNHRQEQEFLRNTTRYNLTPTLTWSFGRLGPINGKTSTTLDYQRYHFPHEEQKKFSKSGFTQKTEFFIEFEKIFGLAYHRVLSPEEVSLSGRQGQKQNISLYQGYMGDIPSNVLKAGKSQYVIRKNSYRHTQRFELKHYFLKNQKYKGNQRFLNQIQEENGAGQFDLTDAIREKEFQYNNEISKTSFPINNTLEFQWNNTLVRKMSLNTDLLQDGRGLRDNFQYDKVSFFNISQGYDFYKQSSNYKDKLTRLFIDAGIDLGYFSSSVQEYYYHSSRKHIFLIDLKSQFERGNVSTTLKYNTLESHVNKTVALGGEYQFNDHFLFRLSWDYDYERERTNFTSYETIYSPSNNCWKLGLKYRKEINESDFSVNFIVNFNSSAFAAPNKT